MNPNDNDVASDSDPDWEAVLAGKRPPAADNKDEQTAEQARQLLIWRHAQNEAKRSQPLMTPEQAQAYYVHVSNIEQQRRHPLWWRIAKYIAIALLLVSLGVGIGYYLMRTDVQQPVQTNTPDAHTTTAMPSKPATAETTAAIASGQTNPPIQAGSPPELFPKMVTVPGGSFSMGCTPGWDDAPGGCRTNEYPAHNVTLPAFSMARHEVTVGQFRHFTKATGYQTVAEQKQQGCTISDPKRKGQWIISKQHNWRDPGFIQTDAHPVVCISWADTQQYLQWLNQETGAHYRLPTEAEWEYAARGKRITAFFWGNQADRHFANFAGTGALDEWEYSAPVGRFAANPFGLHDMAGNVWEWTSNCWQENYQNINAADATASCVSSTKTLRPRRGGSWDTQAPSIRSAYRSFGSEVERSYVYGFRIAHDAD